MFVSIWATGRCDPFASLEVHVKISRSASGKGKEILGEWRFNDRGTGKKTFTFDIPKE